MKSKLVTPSLLALATACALALAGAGNFAIAAPATPHRVPFADPGPDIGDDALETAQKILGADVHSVSQGGLFAPTASTNGTELANRPVLTSGVRFELASGASITYFFAPTGATPSTAPAYVKTVTVAGTTDEPVAGTDSIYVTAVSGTVICRWVLR